jgi:hypothetical protein
VSCFNAARHRRPPRTCHDTILVESNPLTDRVTAHSEPPFSRMRPVMRRDLSQGRGSRGANALRLILMEYRDTSFGTAFQSTTSWEEAIE